jgi:predicted Ser/Thr protein kinase
MIAFACSHCQQPLRVKEDLAGKNVKCPRCGRVTPVPAAVALSGTQAEAPPVLPPAPPAAAEPSTVGTRTDGSLPGPGPGGELTACLSPPQGAGEIGRLGGYRVLKVLGHGGMGVVYKAEDPGLQRSVALKAMLPGLGASDNARKRFLREARAAAAVKHDHIVSIYQVGEDRGVPFLAMEFLEGEPLDERLKRAGRLPLAEVLRIGREIAEGLEAAHERGLVHRDVKPANVWLEGKRGRVKILDFGLARAATEEAQLTQSGAIVGTPAYMAPEQARGEKVDQRCDLFSLGCVLYRLCAGEPPFKGKDTISTLMAVATEHPRPPREASGDVPQALSALVMRLLAKKPEDRLDSARAVAEALEAITPDVARTAKREPAKTQRLPAPRTALPSAPAHRRRAPLVIAVVVLLAGLGVGGYFLAKVVLRGAAPEGTSVVQGPDSGKDPGQRPSAQEVSDFLTPDLAGWEGLREYWTYKNGVLTGSAPQGLKFNTFLCSKKTYRDFELAFQVRLKGPKANSGVQIRSEIFDRQRFAVRGPQVDLGEGFWGGLYGEAAQGTMQAADQDQVRKVLREDDFNDLFVRCVGKHVVIKLNGLTTVDRDFPDLPAEGILAWQLHAGGFLEATFCNIHFTDLSAAPVAADGFRSLFNGQDLTGWVGKNGLPARWRVQDGYMEIVPGTGDIMTRDSFGPDFQLQAEFWLPLMANRRGQARANSGIYLQGRHEIQILDSFGNPDTPARGCGALYGLIAPLPGALKPPEQWQTYDITFHAPRIDTRGQIIARGKLTIVHNGVKVIDNGEFEAATGGALDNRVGTPGPIILQEHGAPVRFRNLRLKELKP